MAKVTRIAYSKNLNKGKLERLEEIAARLGKLRTEVWDKYGSINGVGLSHIDVRDAWLAAGREFDTPARVWKQTLSDVMGDITACREAAKVKVRQAIRRRLPDEKDPQQEMERIRLYTLLKYDRWPEDDYLRRLMRKYWKRGHTSVDNQIVLDTQSYKAFEIDGRAWIEVTSLVSRQRIAIPLNTTVPPTGTIRLIIREGRVEVHYAVDEHKVSVTKKDRKPGEAEIGIDKGYTEAFIDSDGDVHGEKLGELLSQESDYLKEKYKRRNKIKAVARKARKKNNPRKAERIRNNNLGRKKLDRRKKKHEKRVKDNIYQAAHSVVDKAKVIASEDLTAPMNRKSYGKNQNRRLSGWTKGVMAEALEAVTRRRGSTLVLVNPAYTSQIDSRFSVLLGDRKGDLFYCFDGVVMQADQNGARNTLARMYDTEITLYTPYKKVKETLIARTLLFQQRLGLLNQDPSYSGMSPEGVALYLANAANYGDLNGKTAINRERIADFLIIHSSA